MSPLARARGVVLVEALAALLIVAFGMVAMMRLQSTLRRGSDLARQRGEALRLAQQDMETLRAFSVLQKGGASPQTAQDFASISSMQRTITSDLPGSNSDYTINRVAVPLGETLKSIRTTVSWLDRAGEPQSIVLDSAIAGIDPSLSAALAFPPLPTPWRRPNSSGAALPVGAKDLGNGRSVYKPADNGTLAWIFSNQSAAVTGQCTVPMGSTSASLVLADVKDCLDNANGYLLSGVVRFSWDAPPDSEAPAGPAKTIGVTINLTSKGHLLTPSYSCQTDAPVADNPSQSYVAYRCIVYPNSDPTPIWSGYVNLSGLSFTGPNAVKVCRYSADYDGDQQIGNAEHPLQYQAVKGSLRNQNFLVIKASQDCPGGHGVDAAQGDFRNTATVLHQDAATPSRGS